MFTIEQKAWQIHEHNVSFGELHMIVQEHKWDFDNPNGCQNFTMNDAVLVKWEQIFGHLA